MSCVSSFGTYSNLPNKKFHSKFQAGTTTTFSGYTNFTDQRQQYNSSNLSYQYNHYNDIKNNYGPRSWHHINRFDNDNKINYNDITIPLFNRFELLSKLPSDSQHQELPTMKYDHQRYNNHVNIRHRHIRRSSIPNIIDHKLSPSLSNNNYNDISIKLSRNEKNFKGIILSDSMCSRIRTYMIKKFNLIDIELSYESGCDIHKLIKWLKTHDGINKLE